jgi:uncharacterized protein (TIGR03086 family)
MTDVVQLNRRAVLRSVEIVANVTAGDLGRPTPCAGWALENLLGHMIAQHHGFAAAAGGNITDLSAWDVHAVGDDPAGAYAAAAQRLVSAFGADAVLTRPFWLPEIRDGGPFPARTAIGFHLVDYVVHGWDVAASIGVPADFAPDLVSAALAVAEQVPTGAAREVQGAPFGTALPAGADDSPMDHLLRLLGRCPTWPDPAGR